MLVRAANRKIRSNATRARLSCEQLYLPWLCPAYNVIGRDHRRPFTVDTAPQSSGPRRRRNSNDGLTPPPRRTLATAVDSADDIKFVQGPFQQSHPDLPLFPATSPLTTLRPPKETPLYLQTAAINAPKRYRSTDSGVSGDITEILSIFRACLAVGRTERAGVVLKRMLFLENSLTPEFVVGLHNEYLHAATEQVYRKPTSATINSIHKWFELEMHNKQLPIDTDSLVYMLQVSLHTPDKDGDRRGRLVRRYMDIATSRGLERQVLDPYMFSAEKLHEISRYCPEYNVSIAEIAEEAEDLANTNHVNTEGNSTELPTPEVRSIKLKGLGLRAVRSSLKSLINEPAGQPTDPEERREAQRLLERSAVSSAIERWREENVTLTQIGLNTALQTKSLGARMWKWQVEMEANLKVELAKIEESEMKEAKNSKDQERCIYGPFLRLLPLDRVAAVTILSCMGLMSTVGIDKGVTLSQAILKIASDFEDEVLYDLVEKSKEKPAWLKLRKDDKRRVTPALIRLAKRARASGSVPPAEVQDSNYNDLRSLIGQEGWSVPMKTKVGAALLSSLIESAKIPVTMKHPETEELVTQMQPAFTHGNQFKHGKRVGIILANPFLMKQVAREPVHSLLAKHLPMLVEPECWTEFNKGGFLEFPSKIMRIKQGDKDQRHYAEAAIGKGDMTQTFKGLDVLGRTPWRINRPLFEVMLGAWNTGEHVANLPPESPQHDLPAEPSAETDPILRKQWLRNVKIIQNTIAGQHSQRAFQNFQLEIARAMRNEVFYFPHNVDFRGRAYPIPPYLNHMGADHCRGLLMFGKGKELGESGLRWLKIHLANVFGFDKASLKEREDFADRHISKIYDSVEDPYGGTRWWLNAEDPWQFLAACMELKNALDSPDPTKYVSSLPIHQDGTCNGLQHYAALGGDSWGAKQVNLEPGDRPADVYSAVANLVKESVAADKEQGHPLAEVLDGRITRKIVKQTVMTNVYGVTFIGAKAQVRKALVGLYKDLPNDEEMHPGMLATYITTKIFTALSSMFSGAHHIQYWLGECASRICQAVTPEQMERWEEEFSVSDPGQLTTKAKADLKKFNMAANFKSSVIWTTPLHMPVVQPYRVTTTRQVSTKMKRISLSEPHQHNPVSKRKQLQGFPPNFVHSLDATHMLLSALHCDELGLTFAAVHDSFWTHASDIDTMNHVLRDAFIRIHSEDVVGRLAAEFRARYRGCFYLTKVHNQTPVYNKILEHRKMTRKNKGKGALPQHLDDLMEERKRWKLLQSSDPKEVEVGKKMVTAGSIWEEYSSEQDFEEDATLKEMLIGEIPSSNSTSSATTAESDDGAAAEENEFVEEAEQEEEDEGESMTSFERMITATPKKTKGTGGDYKKGWLWLPMAFPPVPKKVRIYPYTTCHWRF